MKKRKWTQQEVSSYMKRHNAFIYFNPNDKNLFVRNRFGIGWTANLGNPVLYILLLVVFLFCILFL